VAETTALPMTPAQALPQPSLYLSTVVRPVREYRLFYCALHSPPLRHTGYVSAPTTVILGTNPRMTLVGRIEWASQNLFAENLAQTYPRPFARPYTSSARSTGVVF
jgi:hypothetical protein